MVPRSIPCLLLVLLIGACQSSSRSTPSDTGLPPLMGRVNDYGHILSDEQERVLNARLQQHEKATTNQVVIVTLDSLEPFETIDEYSVNLANYWKVGQADKDNGVLIALWAGLRKIRIQNGFGLEERLTDDETSEIIEKLMAPEFLNEHYFEGLDKGLGAIFYEIESE